MIRNSNSAVIAVAVVALLLATPATSQSLRRGARPAETPTSSRDEAARAMADIADATAAMTYGALDCSSAPLLACGATRSTSPSCLNGNFYLDLYTFQASAGQTITITTTTTTSYSMLVTVQNTAGIVASKNGPVSVSLSYTFPSAGLYYIGFGYVSNFATGLYTLSISCGSSSGGQCRNLGSLAVGSLVSGTLSAATGSCFGDGTYSGGYRFDGTKDVPLVVTYAASYAPYLSVTTDTGDGGSYRQLSFAGTVSVTYIPSYSGSHWLYIGSNTTTAVSGNYSVRIDAAPTTDPCRRRVAGH